IHCGLLPSRGTEEACWRPWQRSTDHDHGHDPPRRLRSLEGEDDASFRLDEMIEGRPRLIRVGQAPAKQQPGTYRADRRRSFAGTCSTVTSTGVQEMKGMSCRG